MLLRTRARGIDGRRRILQAGLPKTQSGQWKRHPILSLTTQTILLLFSRENAKSGKPESNDNQTGC